MSHADFQAAATEALAGKQTAWSEFLGGLRLTISAAESFEVLSILRDRLKLNMLVDVTCVDNLELPGAKHRFEVVYVLSDVDSGRRLLVSVYLDEPDLDLASVVPLWSTADWLEREVFDMFGIRFVGHPNLKRILMPDAFTSFPLRKDYPMKGRGERHNFPVVTRAES
ncbi:MAG: NADH-quinone oxidoreductase subunit C [Pirellulales bacterium]